MAKIGIIGTGVTIGIADQHVKAYNAEPRATIAAIFDLDHDRAIEHAERWSLDRSVVCGSIEELLDRVDAVSICTPNSTHEELIRTALNAGKHLLCEKPLAHTLESAERSVEEARRHPDLVAMIGFNYRDIPAVRYMKRVIDRGDIGQVYTCRMQLGGNRIANPSGVKLEWRMQEARSGSGALADFGCHLLDLTDYLLTESQGSLAEVDAHTGTFIQTRSLESGGGTGKVTNDDSAIFNARLAGGALLSCLASRVGMPRFTIEIVGEGGMLIFSGTRTELDVWLKDKEGGYDPERRQHVEVGPEDQGRDGHLGLVNDLLDAIEQGRQSDRTLERGLQIQQQLERFAAAARRGRQS